MRPTRADVSVASEHQAEGCPHNREDPRKRHQEPTLILDIAGQSPEVGEDEVCAEGDRQDPVICLNDEDLRHEAVKAAEASLVWVPDETTAHVHRGRKEEVKRHGAVADCKATSTRG